MWKVVLDPNNSKWVINSKTLDCAPCDETFEAYQEGSNFNDEEVQIIRFDAVGLARLKYLGVYEVR